MPILRQCKYYEAKGFSRWAWGLRYFFSSSLSEAKITTQRKVNVNLPEFFKKPASLVVYFWIICQFQSPVMMHCGNGVVDILWNKAVHTL